MLATQSIQIKPPSLEMSKQTRKKLPKAPLPRSISMANLSDTSKNTNSGGIKLWWEKFSGRFKRLNRVEMIQGSVVTIFYESNIFGVWYLVFSKLNIFVIWYSSKFFFFCDNTDSGQREADVSQWAAVLRVASLQPSLHPGLYRGQASWQSEGSPGY